MNNITRFISVILLALFHATAFAYEVGDTIIENGVMYYVVEKHFHGRFIKQKVGYDDLGAYFYIGQVVVIGADKSVKNISVAEELHYYSKEEFNDSRPTVEQFFVMGINDYAFANEKVATINMPGELKHIGTGAFQNMSVAKGLWMPFAYNYGRSVFNGLKADLFFKTSFFKKENERIFSKLDHTFELADSLPQIIIPSNMLPYFSKAKGWPVDNMLCYGSSLLSEKFEQAFRGVDRTNYTITKGQNKVRHKWVKELRDVYFYTGPNGVAIGVLKKTLKKGQKDLTPTVVYNDARDLFSTPYLYSYNNITSPTFRMNDLFFRLESGNQYVYFSLDGKKMEYDVVADKEGLDPFGTRIISEEEIQKRNAKEVNIKKLDKKADDLMKRFGF